MTALSKTLKSIKSLYVLGLVLSVLGIMGHGVLVVMYYFWKFDAEVKAWESHKNGLIMSLAYSFVLILLWLQTRQLKKHIKKHNLVLQDGPPARSPQ